MHPDGVAESQGTHYDGDPALGTSDLLWEEAVPDRGRTMDWALPEVKYRGKG